MIRILGPYRGLAWVRVCAYCTPTRAFLAWESTEKQYPSLFDTSDEMAIISSINIDISGSPVRQQYLSSEVYPRLARGTIRNYTLPRSRISTKLHRNITDVWTTRTKRDQKKLRIVWAEPPKDLGSCLPSMQ